MFTMPVAGGWHAMDENTGLVFFGRTEDEAKSRLKHVLSFYIELRHEVREQRHAEKQIAV